MKKIIPIVILYFGLLLIAVPKVYAYPKDIGIYSSTMIAGSNTNSMIISTNNVIVLVDYQVLSTSALHTDGMDIFDTRATTGAAMRSYTDFTVNSFVDYPLGIELTTGTFISVRGNTGTKVRIRYYRKNIPTGY